MRAAPTIALALLLWIVMAAPVSSSADAGSTREWDLRELPLPACESGYDHDLSLALDQDGIGYVSASWYIGMAVGNDSDAELVQFEGLDISPDAIDFTVDKDGHVHLVYMTFYDTIMYGTNSNGTWVLTEVDDVSMIGGGWAYIPRPKIAVDDTCSAHLCYHSMDVGHELRYATNANGTWVVEGIEGAVNSSSQYSIAVGPGGAPSIAYWNYDAYELRHVTKADGSWTVEMVDDRYAVLSVSNCVAENGTAKVVYTVYDETEPYWRYAFRGVLSATKSGGAWGLSEIETSHSTTFNSVSAALDSNGKMHVSYYDGDDMDLKYATDEGGAWTTQRVDAVDHVGLSTSLCVDEQDRVHIAYYNETSKGVKYAIGTQVEAPAEPVDTMDMFIIVAAVTAVATAVGVIAILKWPR